MTDLTLDRPVPQVQAPAWWRGLTAWLVSSWAHVALVGGIPLTSWAHWQLACLVGTPPWLAWCLPVGIDAYVLAAFLAWRSAPGVRHLDLAWALGLDGLAVAGSHAATLLREQMSAGVMASVAAALGVVQVLVLWRAHALDMRVRATRKPATKVTVTQTTVSPDPVAPRPVTSRRRRATVSGGGDVVAELEKRRDAGMSRAAAAAEVVELVPLSLRSVQRHAARVWGAAA